MVRSHRVGRHAGAREPSQSRPRVAFRHGPGWVQRESFLHDVQALAVVRLRSRRDVERWLTRRQTECVSQRHT